MASGTTVGQSHQLPCTPAEVSKAACLNGGTCFAWDSGGGTRSIGCSCTSEWTGNRCEYMYIDPYDWAVSDASQTIALAIAIPLIIVFIIVALVVFFIVRRKRNDRKRLSLQRPDVTGNHYSTKDEPLQKSTISPQNGQSKMKYDSPDMSASTQLSALSDSQRYSSSNGNQTIPTVFWESAV